ncbi:hypothetical protein PRIPAC_87332 [Pristionchus pacificus]|nr:hypothetical protein PRIPAC_87332 [Pristionchus pacificus]
MDSFGGGSGNARLSQSDLHFVDSQMENFLSDSFGSRFNNMNSMSEYDIRNNLYNTPKDEADPSLCQINYNPSQEQRISDHQEHQEHQLYPFVPLNDDYQQQQHQQLLYMDDDNVGGYVYSQGLSGPNLQYRFMCTVMPIAKSSNRDYLPRKDLLFVKFMTAIPFNFMLTNPDDNSSIPMPTDMNIRMSLRFSTPVSDDKTRVSRCHVHVDRDTNGIHKVMPFIVNHRDAVYDETNLCVTIPSCTVCAVTFYCYSSCAGGIDRKAVFVLFELINAEGTVVQTVECPVKVCANPSRDAPKEDERKRKEEEKSGRGRVKSEASSEMDEKRGRKRKTEDKEEMGREIKQRMESASPMNSLHTPSPGWNPTMSAPRLSTSSRRESKVDIHSPSSDGMAMESNGVSTKTTKNPEDEIFTIQVRGKKKYDEAIKYVKMLEQNERYSARNDEDNVFENLTQMTEDITISTWLSQYHLNEEEYVNVFRSMGIKTLGDIEASYNPTFFNACIGIPQKSAATLNKVYLNWLNVNKCAD